VKIVRFRSILSHRAKPANPLSPDIEFTQFNGKVETKSRAVDTADGSAGILIAQILTSKPQYRVLAPSQIPG